MFIDWCAFSIKKVNIIKGVKVDAINVAVFLNLFLRERHRIFIQWKCMYTVSVSDIAV